MSKIFTKTGDDGFTGLLGEGRVPKFDLRIETLGAVDEATASLGVARAVSQSPDTKSLLLAVQKDLYHLMAEISATPDNAVKFRQIDDQKVLWLENKIDIISEKTQPTKDFIVPGDSLSGAHLSSARTIVRRAERQIARMSHEKQIDNPALLKYLNRLSSLCFALELLENQLTGKSSPTLAKE